MKICKNNTVLSSPSALSSKQPSLLKGSRVKENKNKAVNMQQKQKKHKLKRYDGTYVGQHRKLYPKESSLNLMSINIRKAFATKALDIYKEIKTHKVDIVFLQEVGLSKYGKHIIQKSFSEMKVFTNLRKCNQKKMCGSQFTHKKHFKIPKRGVAILINRQLEKEFDIKQIYKDKKARAIIISLKSEKENILLGNVYAPAEGKRRNRKWIQHFIKVCTRLTKKGDSEILLAGDWNFHLDDLPSYGEQMCEKLKIKWLDNREKRMYTFTKWKKSERKQKILDGWFGTKNLQNKLLNYKINLSSDIRSDHKPVFISLCQQKRIVDSAEESTTLLRNKIIKQTVKKMTKKEWNVYKENLGNFLKSNEMRWEKELLEIKEGNINKLGKIIQEGSNEMIKNIMSTSTGKRTKYKLSKKKSDFKDPLPKKIRGPIKHTSRLLKLYNILEKIKNKTKLSKKNKKLLQKWKLKLTKWESAKKEILKK